ncbi:hypothetical protein J5X84_36355 [Streptosporangiaceae bacterium NEAU-GS5]|nr:hypothetical protein [Streptosporangiaceae bacterium NEAU-GS5]
MTDTTATPADDDQVQVRPFAAVFQELDKGRIHNEASRLLHELVEAVVAHGKKGAMTLRIEVAPLAPGDTSTLTVKAQVDSRPPVNPPTSVFFVDDTGNLTRQNPWQQTLPGLVPADQIRSATR